MTTTQVAAIYARISQDKFIGGDVQEGLNVAGQIEACKNFIKARGWEVGTIYRDDSISATKEDLVRPAFMQMLEDAPEIVVADKQDRLSRSVADTVLLKTAGITGYLLDGGKLAFSTADEEMMTLFRTVMDQAEGRKKSERQKSASLRMARAGIYRGSIRPFGQTLKGDWVQPEADAVVEAAEKLANNEWTFWKVATLWNDAGLKTPLSKRPGSAKGQGGKEWTSGTVKQYFGRPRLKGWQEYDGTLYQLTNWEPLLSEELFDAIQERIKRERKDSSGRAPIRVTTHLLTNICICSICARGANIGYRGGNDSTKYYRCPTPGHGTVTAPPIELAVSRYAVTLLSQNEELRAESENVLSQRTQLQRERNKLVAEHEEWIDDALASKVKASRIAKAEELHDAELQEIDGKLLELDADRFSTIFRQALVQANPFNYREVDLSGWDELEIQKRRELLQTIFRNVEITKSKQGARFDLRKNLKVNLTELGQRLHESYMSSVLELAAAPETDIENFEIPLDPLAYVVEENKLL